MIKLGVYIPLSNSTWESSRLQLARRLSPEDFVTVASFYMTVGTMIGQGFPTNTRMDSVKVGAEPGQASAEAAGPILAREGWSNKEVRRRLEAKVAEAVT